MDCCDAILSRRDLETRRKILKDSSCGAFSVIALVSLAIIGFSALSSALAETTVLEGLPPFVFVPVATLPRCLSAIAVLTLPSLYNSQYNQENPKASLLAVGWTILLGSLALSWCLGTETLLVALASAMGWCLACLGGFRNLQGMSGDISGYAITIGETWGLVALALTATF